ncbi:MAG: hypothetical protein HY553_08245 [Elusimicrobia bacterium]|nr:hypothetical protein [Elusimicrobiota bacterium]
MSGIPRHQRQWDIYRANLGDGADDLILVLSSDETNRILATQILLCEVGPRSLQPLTPNPVAVSVRSEETGLPDAAVIDVATMATAPRNCLVSLEGRLEPVPQRVAVLRGVEILVGLARWP